MKIAFVVFSLRGGGAERVVSELSNQLSGEMDISIIQLSDIKPFYQLDSRIERRSFGGPQNGFLRYIRLARYLYLALRAVRPDVAVSFGETISPFVIAVARLARVPIIASNRASPLLSLRGRRKWLNPIAFRFANAVLVQTERAIEILGKPFRGCRWIIMENPVPVPKFVPPDSSRENICVSVGFLGGQKNQMAVIRAFVKSAPADWSLIIVGDGPDRQMLVEFADDLGLAARIHFTGAVKSVYSILQRARVFAFASRSEGFPNALAEAMAFGCACISYDCVTGPRELIEHGESGLLIDLDDEQAFADGMKSLMKDSVLRGKLSVGARKRASELCVNRVAERFIGSISEVLASDSVRPR